MKMQKRCHICHQDIKVLDFKNSEFLEKFLNPQKKILPRKYTSLCAKHQRKIAKCIKQSRIMGFLPFVPE